MKKEFVVSKIESSQEEHPYVHVTFTDTKSNFSPTRRQRRFPENPVGVAAIPITSIDDLKNLPKKISDSIERAFRGDNTSQESTTFKINSREFEKLEVKKGDKVILEFKISNNDTGV